ncbi:hypothetical protein V6N11_067934 [Hibiscus sabdariffa]|uniref:Uncharacterized protein n=1 Tax=Hibiscus sabdariffa TaxID=183260 RepID=A0ABR2SS96_9ROSI
MRDWFMVNLCDWGPFHDGNLNWSILFPIVCWKLWKKRCSALLDPRYVQVGDLFTHCLDFMREMLAAREPTVVGTTEVTYVRHGLNLAADKLAAMSRSLLIVEQLFSFPHAQTIEHLLNDAVVIELDEFGGVNPREDPGG